jgi:hypothetical protein
VNTLVETWPKHRTLAYRLSLMVVNFEGVALNIPIS